MVPLLDDLPAPALGRVTRITDALAVYLHRALGDQALRLSIRGRKAREKQQSSYRRLRVACRKGERLHLVWQLVFDNSALEVVACSIGSRRAVIQSNDRLREVHLRCSR